MDMALFITKFQSLFTLPNKSILSDYLFVFFWTASPFSLSEKHP
jgi:hypothetical protein